MSTRITVDQLSDEARRRLEEIESRAAETRRLTELERLTVQSSRRAVRELRDAREAAGLSCEEIAARSGLTPEQVRELEEGSIINTDLNALSQYAVALGRAVVVGLEELG